MREDTVRLWRSDFTAGGVAALKTSIARGPPPGKSQAALGVVTPLLEEPVADRRNWTIPRLRAEIEAREGVRISRSQLSPRHTLKGHQTESEVERVGLRLQLRKQQAEAGDLFFSTAMRARRSGRNQGFTDNSDDNELSLVGSVLRPNLACSSVRVRPSDAH